jgi:hypothetical protein
MCRGIEYIDNRARLVKGSAFRIWDFCDIYLQMGRCLQLRFVDR